MGQICERFARGDINTYNSIALSSSTVAVVIISSFNTIIIITAAAVNSFRSKTFVGFRLDVGNLSPDINTTRIILKAQSQVDTL